MPPLLDDYTPLIQFGITLGVLILVMSFVLVTMAYLTYFERKVMGHMQVRLGPMRTGPHGLLQPWADFIKLVLKEDIIPAAADKWVFWVAPLATFIPALVAWAVIPFGPEFTVFGYRVPMFITDINVGVLYVLALSSLGVYGIVMGGWGANSKYSMLGGLRSTAQVISYEVVLGLSLMGVIMLSGSLSLTDIVKAQQTNGWFIFLQPLGFVIYLTAAIAETNRNPFDLPEAESELVAGFHLEYSGMRFALYFLGEYINVLMVSALAATLFLGGWSGAILPPPIWLILKLAVFIFLFYWLRSTLPRFRYDQMMALCWKVLLPLALLNILATAAVKLIFMS